MRDGSIHGEDSPNLSKQEINFRVNCQIIELKKPWLFEIRIWICSGPIFKFLCLQITNLVDLRAGSMMRDGPWQVCPLPKAFSNNNSDPPLISSNLPQLWPFYPAFSSTCSVKGYPEHQLTPPVTQLLKSKIAKFPKSRRLDQIFVFYQLIEGGWSWSWRIFSIVNDHVNCKSNIPRSRPS